MARYRIVRRLGHGGMAEVFEAELAGELGFVRKVAIKRMLGDAAAQGENARRFLDEARIASKLHHANIVSIVDFGLLDGLPFQVLELVDGTDAHQLQVRVGSGLPLEVGLIIANDVAHGLDHAHTALDAAGLPLGIVHRDIKPSNVLVSWNGDVKLTDFGIAVARDRSAKTEAGMVPGTMGFIAPEQRTRSEIDGRTDVFALGLALHAMITGYTPLQDISVEMALLSGTPIELDAALPADIKQLLARAVAPERRDRPTAAQLADALGAALAPRLKVHPRSHLREFLAPLHSNQPKPGALDQLLGFDVVLADEPPAAAKAQAKVKDDDEPRRYALRPTALAGPPSAIGTEPATPAARSSTRRAWWFAAAALVAGTSGVVAWQLAARREPTIEHHALAATPSDAAADAAALVIAPPIDAVTGPVDAGVDAAQLATRPRREPHRSTDAAPAVPPPPAGHGYLEVAGEANYRARVLVDGQPVAFAPAELEVSLGHHRIEVVRTDGTRATQELDVTEYDTKARPARPAL